MIMRITMTGRNIDLTNGLKNQVTKKLTKLEKYFAPDTEVRVVLSTVKDLDKIEVTIPTKTGFIRAEEATDDFYASIDLVEEDLHWWKFRALLVSLTEDCKFVKIIGYRTMDIDPKLPAKQRAFYEKMKREYRLPLSEAEQKREDAIVAALMGDGDVSGLL